MMKTKIYILLLSILFSSLSYAQTKITVSGFVRDSLSSEPLIGVVVANSNMHGTTTNEYGFFSLTINDTRADISFSHIGYKTKNYNITSNIELNVQLSPSTLSIDGIIVSGEHNKFAKTNALGATSINSKQLQFIPLFMGEKDIFKYFQLLPGVNPGKEGSSGMNLRGGSTDQTLILMDDIPIYNSAHAFGFISIFSGDYIKSADLYKGYIPSQYGGRLSGVATMNIREGNKEEHNQSIQLGTTTFSALAEGPISGGKGSYLVGGRYFIPGLLIRGFSLLKSKESSIRPQIGFYDITAKVSYDISKNSTIYGSFYTGNDAIKFTFHETGFDIDGDQTLGSKSKSGLSWGNIVGSVRLSSKISNKSFFNMTSYYSHLSNSSVATYEDTQNKFFKSDIKSTMGELGIKANMNHNLNDWYNLTYGLHLAYQHFIPQNINFKKNSEVRNTKHGERDLYSGNLFIDNKFRFNDLHLNLGGRLSLYNNNKESKVVAEPRVAFTYYRDKSSLWISYVRNSQPLFSMNQQMLNVPIDYWIPFQNKNELPVSQQVSAGYKRMFDFGLELQGEAYYKKSKNVSIVYNVSDFLLEEGGYELATGEAYGAEILGQYTRNRFNVMASYTYSKSLHYIKGKTINFVYDTPHNLNILTSYKTLINTDRTHTVSMNVNYKSGLPYFLSNEKYPLENGFDYWDDNLVNYPMYANSRLVDFFRVDLSYTMEKRVEKGSRIWQLSILNATAHRNPYIVYYSENHKRYKALQLIPFLPSFSYIRRF